MTENYCQNGRIGPRNSGLVPSIFFLREGSSLEPVPKPDYELIAKLEEWPLDLAIKVMHDVAGDIAEDFRFETGFGSNYSFNQVREVALQAIGAKKLDADCRDGDVFVRPASWVKWFKLVILDSHNLIPKKLEIIGNDKKWRVRKSDKRELDNIKARTLKVIDKLRAESPHMNKKELAEHRDVKKIAIKLNNEPYSPNSICGWMEGMKFPRGRPLDSKKNQDKINPLSN